MRAGRTGIIAAAVLLGAAAAASLAYAPVLDGRDALWRIVSGQCVPEAQAGRLEAPCEAVDPAQGVAIIKDRVGIAQMLAIPTARISGIEDPALLSPGLPGLWPAAWAARRLAERHLGRPLPRDLTALALNSALGRSQDQLHIHVDCLRAEVRDQLRVHATEIGESFTAPGIDGHAYRVRRLAGETLDGLDPVRLVAEGVPGAAQAMGRHTVAVAGAVFPDGSPGFYLLDGEADPAAGDLGHAEDMLDHDCTAVQ